MLLACLYRATRFSMDVSSRALREDVEDRLVVESPLLLRRPEEHAVEVVGVSVVTGPSIEEDLCLACLDTTEVIGVPGCCVRDDLEPGLRQARRECLEVLHRVRHVRARDARRIPEVDRHRQLQPSRLQQRLRLRRAVRVLLDAVGVAEEARRLELLRHHSATAVERLDHGCAVEAVGERLPHLDVVHRRHRLVHADDADVERWPRQELEAAVALDRRDVLRLDEVVALDLTVLQCLQTSGVVGDRPEDELAENRLLAPVVRVADEHELVAARPRLEHERTGACRVRGRVRAGRMEDTRRVDRALICTVLLHGRRAADEERRQGQRAEERC